MSKKTRPGKSASVEDLFSQEKSKGLTNLHRPPLMMYTPGVGEVLFAQAEEPPPHVGFVLVASKRAAARLSNDYSGFWFTIKAEEDEKRKLLNFASITGRSCYVTLDVCWLGIDFSECEIDRGVDPSLKNGVSLRSPEESGHITVDLEPHLFQDPPVIATVCQRHRCWRMKLGSNNLVARGLSKHHENVARDCERHNTEQEIVIMISCPFTLSVYDLPLEIVQLFFSFLPGDPPGGRMLANLSKAFKEWEAALSYVRLLARRPWGGWGENLVTLLQRATSLESAAIFNCGGLRSISLCPTTFSDGNYRSLHVWTLLETLFRLSRLVDLDIKGPLSFDDSSSSRDIEDILALRWQVWRSGIRKHNLNWLILEWETTETRRRLHIQEKRYPEPRWTSIDALALLLYHSKSLISCYRFRGIDFWPDFSIFYPSGSWSSGYIDADIYFVDCRMKSETFVAIPTRILTCPHFSLERCIGPGRLSIRDVSHFLSSMRKELEKLELRLWPWAKCLFADRILDQWTLQQQHERCSLNLIFTSEFRHLRIIEIDGMYEALQLFSSPLIPILPQPNLYSVVLEYCSGLRGCEVVTIIEEATNLRVLTISVFFADWEPDEIRTVEEKWDERSEKRTDFKFSDGSSSVREEWECCLGEFWSDEEVQEELDLWER